MARLQKPLTATLAAALLWGAVIPAAAAQTGPTFGCDPGFYQVISGQLHEFAPGTNAYRAIGADGPNYNAMGHRIADGYVYALSGQTLLRVDAAGVVTELATLDIGDGPYTGDFGDDGLLHASRGGREWVAIDVETMAVTPRPDLSVHSGVADIANVHGVFYGVSTGGSLYRIDPAAGSVVDLGPVAGLPASPKAYGAAWATAGGNLYVGRNSGEIYQITGYTTSSPTATQVGSATPTSSNDGASCSLAAPPAGVPDVDGPEPESEPLTDEAKQANETYQTSYVEPTYETNDAGIGTGAACDPTVDEDRLQRLDESAVLRVDAPTELYRSGANGPALADFRILSGNWADGAGSFDQLNTCGFDYTALLRDHYVSDFRFETTVRADDGPNHAGLLFHQSDPTTRSGAMLVDLADGGATVRWGHYDDLGYYQFLGSAAIPSPAAGAAVRLGVEVHGAAFDVIFDGEVIASGSAPSSSGLVGLVANQSAVSFAQVALTALPPVGSA